MYSLPKSSLFRGRIRSFAREYPPRNWDLLLQFQPCKMCNSHQGIGGPMMLVIKEYTEYVGKIMQICWIWIHVIYIPCWWILISVCQHECVNLLNSFQLYRIAGCCPSSLHDWWIFWPLSMTCNDDVLQTMRRVPTRRWCIPLSAMNFARHGMVDYVELGNSHWIWFTKTNPWRMPETNVFFSRSL